MKIAARKNNKICHHWKKKARITEIKIAEIRWIEGSIFILLLLSLEYLRRRALLQRPRL